MSESNGKQAVHTDGAPRPAGAYSQGVVAGGFLFTAGFGPQDPVTGAVPEGVGAQTAQVLRNVGAVLAARGLSPRDVVKVTAHLQHLRRDFAAYDAAYREFFEEPHPVRTTVGSDLMDILVEIDVVALLPGPGPDLPG
ncbi:reactive intermediate/imine deaminase [Streptomyces anthocyanicus]|uniref:RidA family protein n=1 Tax=Streptomyces violaceolatus TaxID=67378 RepID=A0ABN3SKN9_9ACTN|nr:MULTISPECIES: RidA family protein [Streptomyces]MDX3315584.1 RidA family protein [Streptomyces sp. ME03-5684b]MDX3344224.1 RidA family protein [Streptomyces sp. ME02-6979A]MDX3399155.1 RidA family protein [Streptomyces sp. ME01-18h]THA98423.1 RidA family protein [Streptomyces sp. LRa12]WTC13239.1 RidA family protein [Streptomyces anthocyanicus]